MASQGGAGAGAGAGKAKRITPGAAHNILKQLNNKLQEFNFRKALKLSEQYLNHFPTDQDVLRVKCVCLLNESKYPAALAMCNAHPALFPVEKAYCLYRMGKLDEAQTQLSTLPADDTRVQHVSAQIAYRQRDFSTAITAYLDLLQKLDPEEDDIGMELVANAVAAFVSAGRSTDLLTGEHAAALSPDVCEGSFELLFNHACAWLHQNKFKRARRVLAEALECAEDELKEEDEQELATQTSIIKCQLAYARQMQSNMARPAEHAAVHDVYQALLASSVIDGPVRAVASNNMAALKGATELGKSVKRVRVARTPKVAKAMTTEQLAIVGLNAVILTFHQNKPAEETAAALAALPEASKALPAYTLLQAALTARSGDVPGAIAQCQTLLTAKLSTTDADDVRLFVAQLLQSNGQTTEAADMIASASGVAHHPATVAVLAALHAENGDMDKARAVFSDAADKWKAVAARDGADKKQRVRATKLFQGLLRRGAEFCMTHNFPAGAAELAASMTPPGTSSTNTAATQSAALQLVANAEIDTEAALKLSQKLLSKLPAMPSAEELDALEAVPRMSASGVPDQPAPSQAAAPATPEVGAGAGMGAGAAGDEDEDGEADYDLDDNDAPTTAATKKKKALSKVTAERRAAKKKAKRKAAHLAKLLATGQRTADTIDTEPDPDRWLPKHQRRRGKKYGRKRRQINTASGASQGAGAVSAATMDKLDAAKRAASGAKATTATSSTHIATSKANSRRKGKKKGRRR